MLKTNAQDNSSKAEIIKLSILDLAQLGSLNLKPNQHLQICFNQKIDENLTVNLDLVLGKNSSLGFVWEAIITAKLEFNLNILLEKKSSYNFKMLNQIQAGNLQINLKCEQKGCHTKSNINIYNLLKSEAVSKTNVRVILGKKAFESQANLAIKNLVLDENCEANSQPELEILNKEVEAKHSATTGFLEPKIETYLNSRGLNLKKIKLIITDSFIQTFRKIEN